MRRRHGVTDTLRRGPFPSACRPRGDHLEQSARCVPPGPVSSGPRVPPRRGSPRLGLEFQFQPKVRRPPRPPRTRPAPTCSEAGSTPQDPPPKPQVLPPPNPGNPPDLAPPNPGFRPPPGDPEIPPQTASPPKTPPWPARGLPYQRLIKTAAGKSAVFFGNLRAKNTTNLAKFRGRPCGAPLSPPDPRNRAPRTPPKIGVFGPDLGPKFTPKSPPPKSTFLGRFLG